MLYRVMLCYSTLYGMTKWYSGNPADKNTNIDIIYSVGNHDIDHGSVPVKLSVVK